MADASTEVSSIIGSDPEKKIFVGGLGWDVNEKDLQDFFEKIGEVKNVQIRYDPNTGRSRGFAFVEFNEGDACQEALKNKKVEIKGKQVEIKRAVARENKKIFVGGVSSEMSEESIREYFAKFGEVEEIDLPVDRNTNRRRNFAFIIFVNEDSADAAAQEQKHLLGCDVKKATPNRGQGGRGGGAGNEFGGYRGGGGQNYNSYGDMGGTGNPYQDYYQAWYNYYYSGYPNYPWYQGQGGDSYPNAGHEFHQPRGNYHNYGNRHGAQTH